MSTTEREQQILREIEWGLRSADRFLAARFALLPVRAAMHRHPLRVLLVAEAALLILAALAVLARSELLLVPVIGLSVAELLIAVATRSGGS